MCDLLLPGAECFLHIRTNEHLKCWIWIKLEDNLSAADFNERSDATFSLIMYRKTVVCRLQQHPCCGEVFKSEVFTAVVWLCRSSRWQMKTWAEFDSLQVWIFLWWLNDIVGRSQQSCLELQTHSCLILEERKNSDRHIRWGFIKHLCPVTPPLFKGRYSRLSKHVKWFYYVRCLLQRNSSLWGSPTNIGTKQPRRLEELSVTQLSVTQLDTVAQSVQK